MTFGALRADRIRIAAILIVLVAGAGLRLWQYGANSSLWLDEAAVSRNIIERSASELLTPLNYGQVAPVGFLLVQHAVTRVSTSEYALRIFPLLSGLAAMLLFVAVARATLTGGSVPYAVLLFALGPPFIYFSSQAKQYAPDTAASMLAVWIVMRSTETSISRRGLLLLTAAGALIPWISTSAALVLTGAAIGAATLALARRDTTARRTIALPLVIWIASAFCAGLIATRTVSPETREFLDWFWRAGYIPLTPVAQVRWYWTTLNSVFGSFGAEAFRTNGGLGYPWPQLFTVATITGFLQLARTRPATALVLFGPVLVAVAASLAHLYPLSGRLLVFLLPVLLLATAAGAQAIWSWFGDRSRFAGLIAAAVFVVIPVYTAVEAHPPYSIQPLRPVLERLESLRQPGDIVYVDYAAAQAFLYYAARFDFETGDYVISRCSVADRRDYLRQVDRFRGHRRVWIVATHLSTVERLLTVGYLEEIGHRIESVFVAPVGAPLPFAAYARLYDLSDPRRLARSSAATYQFRDVSMTDDEKRWGCFGPALSGE